MQRRDLRVGPAARVDAYAKVENLFDHDYTESGFLTPEPLGRGGAAGPVLWGGRHRAGRPLDVRQAWSDGLGGGGQSRVT